MRSSRWKRFASDYLCTTSIYVVPRTAETLVRR
jgi:hypothetical protein